jgi:hypothetical protein
MNKRQRKKRAKKWARIEHIYDHFRDAHEAQLRAVEDTKRELLDLFARNASPSPATPQPASKTPEPETATKDA